MNNLTKLYEDSMLMRSVVANIAIHTDLVPEGVGGGELKDWLLSEKGEENIPETKDFEENQQKSGFSRKRTGGLADDSREKIEADIRDVCADLAEQLGTCVLWYLPNETIADRVISFIDRQDAVTHRRLHENVIGPLEDEVGDLEYEIAELEAKLVETDKHVCAYKASA